MTKKVAALAALVLLLLTQRPQAQAGQARIFFVDVGTGASTLIVSPAGKTILVDGGPPGSGAKITSLLDTLGIATIDYTVITHYHIDHMGGLIDVLNAGRVAGIAYDNGDGADVQPPGTSVSSTSTRGTYLNYVTATGHAGVTRQTAAPGNVVDLGGGMRATFVASGGHLLSGGSVAITTSDLNSESISTLVEYNNFDFLVSGDLTGGGSTSTAKTPDVETYVAQMVGDVDVVQLDHHGSTTGNNQTFLGALKAEVAFAQTGETNTFGHPNRETANKFLNTLDTIGASFAGTGVPAAGIGPVLYQNEASPAGDDRVTRQGYTGAAAGDAGHGTVLLATDGTASYSLSSFDDGGARLSSVVHTYAVDGVSSGVTVDFKPTVVVQTSPVLPLANENVTVSAAVNDRESPISIVTLAYAVNGVAQAPLAMPPSGGVYQATIPSQPEGTRVDYAVTATAGGQSTTYRLGYFSGVTPILSLRALTPNGEPLYAGYPARIQGTATASGFSAGTNDDYVQDVTGGVNIYRSTNTPTPYTSILPGQLVEVFGRIGFNGGRLRLDITESVEKVSSPFGIVVLAANLEPVPAAVTIAGLNTDPESFEGQFVSIANCTIASGSIPATPQSIDAFVTIADGTGTFSLKIDHDTDIEGFTTAAPFTVAGIIQQDDYLRPFDSGYNIAPRSRVDLGAAAPAPTTLLTVGEARVDQVNNVDGTAGADFIPDRLNQLVRIRGTVSSIDFRGGTGVEYYIQDGTGGADLFNSGTNFGPYAIGDSVEALGTVTQFNGLTEVAVTSLSLLSSGNALTPLAVTLSQLANGGGEALEGQLIRIDNVAITSGLFPASGASGNVTIADATGTGALRVDSDTDIDGTATPAPGSTLSIVGILGQFSSAPFDSGYQLLPRALTDIAVTSGSGPALTAAPATLTFAPTSVGSVLIAPVTITNNGGSSLTLTTPLTIAGTDAAQFAVGAPGTAVLTAGSSTTVSVTFAPATGGAKSATLTIGSSNGSTTVALTGTATAPGGATAVVISEVRFRGPSGGNDEFVEIYNNSDNPSDISGWKLLGSSNTAPTGTRATVPANVTLPGRAHYLFINTAASGYSGGVPGNVSYTTGFGDNGGAALARPDGTTIADQVGVQTITTGYREGTAIATQLTTSVDRAYQRLPGGSALVLTDANNNSTDFALTAPGNPQNLVLIASPASVNFGSAAPGDTRSQTVTIRNLLLSAVTLNAPSLTGTDVAAFANGAPSPTTVAAGATATIVVTFQPVDSGAKSASLVVTSTSAGSVTIPLSGTGSGGLTVSPTTIDFGTVQPGASASSTVTITNTDATGVTLTPPFAITGANAADFGAGAPGTAALAGGSSTSLALSFQPAAPGPKSAALQITTSSGTTRTVILGGIGTCPAITVSGPLPNGSAGMLYAGIVNASGGDAPYSFSVSGGTLPGGLTLSASGVLSGTPNATGTFTFTVQAAVANGCSGNAPFTVNVVPAPIVLTASPATLTFGIVPISTPATQTVTLTNVSASPIVLSTPFTLSGADSARFSAAAPGASALGPGASTTTAVTFLPSTGGVRNATLTVSPSGGAPVAVTLTGAGAVATPVVVSEFRFHGPAGGSDEFVEIYNNTDAPIDISGWMLMGSSNGSPTGTRATVPAGVTLPGRTHYLFVHTVYSGTVPGNASYNIGISDNGGVALARADGTIVDQVGVQTTSGYREGTAIATQLSTSVDRGYERKPGGAAVTLQDTDDNATDFQLTTPSAPQSVGLIVAPTTLDFGSVVQTTAHSQSVLIRNLLLTPVTLDAPAMAGTDAAGFAAGAPGTLSLASAASTTVTVTLQAQAPGVKSAALLISGAGADTVTVPLAALVIADTTAPALTLPGDITTEASSAETTVTYTATALDPIDGPIVPLCWPASGSGFAVGTTTVNCTATDPHANSATGTFTVTVTDHTAPLVAVPGDIATEATGAGTPVTFRATAADLVDGSLVPSCSPASGFGFPVGTTPVTCTAADAHGNSASAGFTVTVADTTAPTVFVPSNITTEATGATTPVSFAPSATDSVDGARPVVCAPSSGSAFSVGTTTVACTATDTHGNGGTATFSVTVTDQTPPEMTVPANIAATATTPSGATVAFAASAWDLVDGTRAVACAPASRSTFAIGATTVTCTASDLRGNNVSRSFTVTVETAEVPGRMTGDFAIQIGSVRHGVDFSVQERISGAEAGSLRYKIKTRRSGRDLEDRFESTVVTEVSFFDVPGVSPGRRPPSGVDTVSFTGTGRWNDSAGYTFSAVAIDAGEPGRGRDSCTVTIKDAGGLVVATVNATITDGNIQSLRPRR